MTSIKTDKQEREASVYLLIVAHHASIFSSRYELHMHTSCPSYLQPREAVCKLGPVEVKYAGDGQRSNVSDLQPYTTYNLRVVSYNSVGSTASEWISFTTKKEGELIQESIRNVFCHFICLEHEWERVTLLILLNHNSHYPWPLITVAGLVCLVLLYLDHYGF